MRDGFEDMKAQDNSGAWAMVLVAVLILGVIVGAFIGSPSSDQRKEAQQLKENYRELREQMVRADSAPKDNWACRQGAVDVTIQTSERYSPNVYTYSSNGFLRETGGMARTIKTVSEHTTMDCTRQVKEYVEKTE